MYSTAIVGGGFFGCALARRLAEQDHRVLLLDAERDLLTRASFANQARVHQGYHYPLSFQTAVRSRLNYGRFIHEFADCVVDDVRAYYAVARKFSRVTGRAFARFCERIGAPCRPADPATRALFNAETIDEVFAVEERVFDADRLRQRLSLELARAGVEIALQTRVTRVQPDATGGFEILATEMGERGKELRFHADQVFNCCYSQLNRLHVASDLPTIPLRHEWAELALIELPPAHRSLAVTVMCGPFFSVLPFPPRGLHTLSHVRYTPHVGWLEQTGAEPPPTRPIHSQFDRMIRHARQFVPLLGDARYQESLFEVKTILPRNDDDDGRPMLVRCDHGRPGFHAVLGAKIDNVHDLLDEIDRRPIPASVREAS